MLSCVNAVLAPLAFLKLAISHLKIAIREAEQWERVSRTTFAPQSYDFRS